MQKKFWLMALLSMAVICIGRWMPHPPNFTPLVGASLFAGAIWSQRVSGYMIPLIGFWLSDLFLNNVIYASYYSGFVLFSEHFMFSALALLAIVAVGGFFLKKRSMARVGGFAVVSSLLFFLVSNFGVWMTTPAFGAGASGLSATYAAGLPFLWNGLMGDLVYTGIFFGAFEIYRAYQAKPESGVRA